MESYVQHILMQAGGVTNLNTVDNWDSGGDNIPAACNNCEGVIPCEAFNVFGIS